jgi:hypothetical protein
MGLLPPSPSPWEPQISYSMSTQMIQADVNYLWLDPGRRVGMAHTIFVLAPKICHIVPDSIVILSLKTMSISLHNNTKNIIFICEIFWLLVLEVAPKFIRFVQGSLWPRFENAYCKLQFSLRVFPSTCMYLIPIYMTCWLGLYRGYMLTDYWEYLWRLQNSLSFSGEHYTALQPRRQPS